MSAIATQAARLWAASKRAGFLSTCYYVAPGGDVRKTVYVRYEEPDREALGGQITKDYRIEYQVVDLPDLAEGDVLSIEKPDGCAVDFRVREEPYVDVENGDDGLHKFALLTKVRP